MPRQSRPSRNRSRTRRPEPSARPIVGGSPVATEEFAPPTTPPSRATVARSRTTSAATSRAFVTDYGYVIGEMKRILVLTAIIVGLMLVLWLVLG